MAKEKPVVANRHTKQFHLREFASGSCQIAEIVDGEEFETFEEAIVAQYEGCAFCLSHIDKREADAER